jgi:acyl-CoA hydrolase
MALFTGLITDAVMDLIESGAVDRPVLPGHGAYATGAVVRGSSALYRWSNDNPSILLADALLTHAPEIMARLPRFVALNGALQVDLVGNVNSLSVGGRILGGLGGAIDYATAGAYASGSVIALESMRGGRSCIVQRVDYVTIPGLFVTHVVTEYGVAALTGLSAGERANALIRIAAPEYREALSRAS